MNISVTDPIGDAFEWMKKVLFRPFDFKKWLVLGFCAFLAGLGQGGCQVNVNFGGGDGGPVDSLFGGAIDWVRANPELAAAVIAAIVAAGLALFVLFQWLSSRGIFMFLDGVIHDRAAVTEPWHRFREAGNSLFLLRMLLIVFGLLAFVLIAGGAVLIAWPDIDSGTFGTNAFIALFVGILLFLLLAIALGMVNALLVDFAVQIMYRRGTSARESLGILWRQLLWPNVWSFVLFYLMKMVLGIAAAAIAFVAICLTCCIAALPYVNSVVLLPIAVFFRAYSIFFLAQCGDDWSVMPAEPEQSPPPENAPMPAGPGQTGPAV
jgi:hypothetical protein